MYKCDICGKVSLPGETLKRVIYYQHKTYSRYVEEGYGRGRLAESHGKQIAREVKVCDIHALKATMNGQEVR